MAEGQFRKCGTYIYSSGVIELRCLWLRFYGLINRMKECGMNVLPLSYFSWRYIKLAGL